MVVLVSIGICLVVLVCIGTYWDLSLIKKETTKGVGSGTTWKRKRESEGHNRGCGVRP